MARCEQPCPLQEKRGWWVRAESHPVSTAWGHQHFTLPASHNESWEAIKRSSLKSEKGQSFSHLWLPSLACRNLTAQKQLRLSSVSMEGSFVAVAGGCRARHTQWPCLPPAESFSLQSQAGVVCCGVAAALQVLAPASGSASVQSGRELKPSTGCTHLSRLCMPTSEKQCLSVCLPPASQCALLCPVGLAFS